MNKETNKKTIKKANQKQNQKKKYFVFTDDYIEKSLKNLQKEEDYDNFVEVIKALGKM